MAIPIVNVAHGTTSKGVVEKLDYLDSEGRIVTL